MSELDDRIREALKGARESDELFEEQNFLAEVMTPFRGRRRWINGLGLFYGLIGMGVLVWAGIRLFGTDVVNEQIRWAAIGFLGLAFVSFLKVYFWMEMHSNRVLRELKRIELLVLQRDQDEPRR